MEFEVADSRVLPAKDNTAKIVLTNYSGFIQVLDSGTVIGQASPVVIEADTSSTQQQSACISDLPNEDYKTDKANQALPLTQSVAVFRVVHNSQSLDTHYK